MTLLEPEVGIEAEAGLAMPDIADRHADPKFATARLRPGGVKHARPDHPKLELADAALHAEQQAVVRQAGIVDAIEVDDTRLDKPAQFEQVVPVPALACQPRSVKAEHGADFPGAQGGDKLLEPGRATMPLAERPRSSSITSTVLKPRRRAISTSSYCRRRLSVLSSTWAGVDWRT